ncbi:MAG: carboxypeptidase regulatory-like domain-containing protein [Bacteroidales bacterium]|nr:carboxypeptidase regulatory-like domain-containing protein [Bacteroidales bacterium]
MKNSQLNFALLAVCLIGLWVGCSKEEVLLPDLKGSLVGYVFCFDEYANLLNDQGHVQVTAIGLKQYSCTSDENGRFEFTHLPAGTYELHFEKAGFGTLKQFGIQHFGGKPTVLGLSLDGSDGNSAFFLYQIATSQVVDMVIENDTIKATLSFDGAYPEYVDLVLFLSDASGFNTDEAKAKTTRSLVRHGNIYEEYLYPASFPFEPGQQVFVRACVVTTGALIINSDMPYYISGIETYYDYLLHQTIYPNQGNESAQFTFIMPE